MIPQNRHRPRHIGIIPARKNSKGVPKKNRYLFDYLGTFLTKHGLFDQIIVTSDDPVLLEKARNFDFDGHRRPDALADDSASIKQAFSDLASTVLFNPDDYLWLLFIPLVFRRSRDFKTAREIVDKHQPSSFCSFIAAQTHPFTCWKIDKNSSKVTPYIDNDVFNRQDFPDAWENYNYLCCIKAGKLPKSNANLITEDVFPFILDTELANNMIEIDEPSDLKKWQRQHPDEFLSWSESLCPDDRALIYHLMKN